LFYYELCDIVFSYFLLEHSVFSLVKDMDITRIILEGDSEIITKALQEEKHGSTHYSNVIEDKEIMMEGLYTRGLSQKFILGPFPN
jgi:hypothetical protein